MQTTTLSFENIHNHGELFANFFRARKQCFKVKLKWDLPEALDMEYDQYDTPASRWIAVHDLGEIVGGIRLTPTQSRLGIYTYMIKDAQAGHLTSLPSNLLYEEAPVDAQTWECSRVFISGKVPQARRAPVRFYMLNAMLRASRELGATKLITLTPANWPLWLKRCGLEGVAKGPVLFIEDGEYQCVEIDLGSNLH